MGDNLWKTCDLKAVAFLLHKGFKVMDYGKFGARVFFAFEDTMERKEAVLAFMNRGVKVEPLSFLDSLSQARDMVTMSLKV